MVVASTSGAGVRYLWSVKDGHSLKRSAREAGVGMETGYRWLRESYLCFRREGKSAAETGALLGFVSARAASGSWRWQVVGGTIFKSTLTPKGGFGSPTTPGSPWGQRPAVLALAVRPPTAGWIVGSVNCEPLE